MTYTDIMRIERDAVMYPLDPVVVGHGSQGIMGELSF